MLSLQAQMQRFTFKASLSEFHQYISSTMSHRALNISKTELKTYQCVIKLNYNYFKITNQII